MSEVANIAMYSRIPYARFVFAAALAMLAAAAQASVGLTEIVDKDGDGPVTIYYPSSSDAQPVKRGQFTLQVAWQGVPVRAQSAIRADGFSPV
jgi:hypothetical protein